MGAERDRLRGDPDAVRAWREWGPFVSEREWGTVREDYSADGEAWRFVTHDEARSYAYRWGEDGLAGVCDRRQGVCLALALWNGRDLHLKERLFGLTGKEGNHGEDVKECSWNLDATPTHSWLRWRYHYPQEAFPYEQIRAENARRGFHDPEYELADTGVLDAGFWSVEVEYAKASPDDLCMRIRATNHGPAPATLHVLPTLWFRNIWSWGTGKARPAMRGVTVDDGDALVVEHPRLGRWIGGCAPAGRGLLFCENETNGALLYGSDPVTPFPTDGIGDHVVAGSPTVNPARTGTKAAWWIVVDAGPGETAEVRVRFAAAGDDSDGDDGAAGGRGMRVADLREEFDAVMASRAADADAFYAELIPADTAPDEAVVARQAIAGLLWSQQFYRYDVAAWIDGDPAGPAPPPGRGAIRNGRWRHVDANDVICMPDKWEYPWFASWDLAFHCVALAHADPELAKEQLLLLCREWYMHANGQLPAYEWEFGDANPPVHAWAAMRVFEIDGSTDHRFLARMFHKLLLNFTWWVNRQDAEGNNAFEGGFLGLDNIGPFNRSEHLPIDGVLEQSDGTGWMAMYCLNMLDIALALAARDRDYEDVAVKFLEHFAFIATAMNQVGFWDEDDGFFYDIVRLSSGETVPLRVRSMVGLVPLVALSVVRRDEVEGLDDFVARATWFFEHKPTYAGVVGRYTERAAGDAVLLSVVSPDRLRRVLASMLDEAQFLSPHGLRSLSRWHLDHPVDIDLGGATAQVRYEPAESTSGLFGGNSNWRGPVWFPLNFLVIEALRRYHEFLGDDFTVEVPAGSGVQRDLAAVADELAGRLIGLFLAGPDGTRPFARGRAGSAGGAGERTGAPTAAPTGEPLLWFHEYFDGDTGAGLGANHQTGWTALVADLVLSRRPRG